MWLCIRYVLKHSEIEWVSLDDILKVIEKSPDATFKALVFKELYQSLGANNHGFLAAALRSESIIIPDEDRVRSNTLGDIKTFKVDMQKLVKDNVSLDDEGVAADKIRLCVNYSTWLFCVKNSLKMLI